MATYLDVGEFVAHLVFARIETRKRVDVVLVDTSDFRVVLVFW